MTVADAIAALQAYPWGYTGLVLVMDDSPRYELTDLGRAMLEGRE